MYQVRLTPTAAEMFNQLHPDIRKELKAALKGLCETPYMGKALQDKLFSLHSLKMKRYRAVYQINDQDHTVTIQAIGHRRDIYEIMAGLAAF